MRGEHSADGLRRSIYWLIITAALGVMLGRILAVDSVDRRAIERSRLAAIPSRLAEERARLQAAGVPEQQIKQHLAVLERKLKRQAMVCRPFLSANDRSRWATVRALVEPDMRVPGAPYAIDRVIQEPNWDTIDLVKHDGHLYSSKPPILATLVAAIYWVIYNITGWSLGEHPYLVGRIILIVVNLLPMAFYFALVAKTAERYGHADWGRLFVVVAAGFGTFLSSFAVVLNNHLLAAVAAMGALYCVLRICIDGQRHWRYFFGAGLGAALTAALELPALAFLAAMTVLLLLREPWGMFWRVATGRLAELRTMRQPLRAPRLFVMGFLPPVLVVAAAFFGTNWVAHRSLRPPYMHRSKTDPSDNWYVFTYEIRERTIHSYWSNPVGIDRGEENPWVYAFHVLIGHHGVFSLTPIWVLSVWGAALWIAQTRNRQFRELALMLVSVTLVCIAFYLLRPVGDRNYGGMTCGFRWLFWFTPIWLFLMLPALDRMARHRITRVCALILLLVSVMSASYPTWNPWTHPWLTDWLLSAGLISW